MKVNVPGRKVDIRTRKKFMAVGKVRMVMGSSDLKFIMKVNVPGRSKLGLPGTRQSTHVYSLT